MSLHFSGNQFEQAYKPRVLRNWEVPKQYDDKPKKRTGHTQIISNDRGHLLPGVRRSTEPRGGPWGNYVGTWHLPKKIDRKTADELNGTLPKISCEEKRKLQKQKLEKIKEENETKIEETVEETKDKVEEVNKDEGINEKVEEQQLEKEKNKEDSSPYVPGDLTEEQHQLSSHEILAKDRFVQDKQPIKCSGDGYPKYRDDFSKPLLEIEKKTISRDEVEEMYQNHREMLEKTYSPKEKQSRKKKLPSPIVAAIKNFQLAKKLHRENLEHDPLPDTITHKKYCQLQMQRSEKDPGLALKDENFATGIGWKGYPGYGPTRCTKLKVYRPKTCGHSGKNEEKNDGRPSSVTSFDRKWRFIRQRKVSPIELAICWDLTPENPQDEPKRTPHIDGSNGSLAPAVFSLVATPKDEGDSKKSSIAGDCGHDSGPIFEKAPTKDLNDKDFILDRPKTSQPQEIKRRTSHDSSQSGESLSKKRAKSAYNLNNNGNDDKDTRSRCSHCSHCSQCCRKEVNKDVHQSTPNLSDHGDDKKIKNSRMCMACEMKNVSLKDKPRKNNNEYKMAFKAGIPQKCVSNSSYNRNARYNFNVPKQKDPYSPKNYAIRSLAPPFSLQKDKRQDYPEHWRLATVYQHSYKPIHTRKRPMLATVFK